MNIFFTRRYKYKVDLSIEEVEDRISSFINTKWYTTSPNIAGIIKDNHNFTLWHKWSLVYIQGIERSPAYLHGKLFPNGETATIHVKVRPSSSLLIGFYLLAGLFLCELFGIKTFINVPQGLTPLFFVPFIIITFVIMQIYTTGLRRRFERLMGVQLID